MLERLQKPFLTVETGEAYQPIRLSYHFKDKDALIQKLSQVECIEKNQSGNWSWYWKNECDDIHFESGDTFQRSNTHPVRLGTLTFKDQLFFVNLPSFKRACLAVPFFHKLLFSVNTKVQYADFLNKVYGLDERLPHGFTELFKEEELAQILAQRIEDFKKIQEACEKAENVEEALRILQTHNEKEANKKLPFAERYEFDFKSPNDADTIFLGFYIFLRGRELVAIRRWFGETGYTLGQLGEEAVKEIFGDVGIDLVD